MKLRRWFRDWVEVILVTRFGVAAAELTVLVIGIECEITVELES